MAYPSAYDSLARVSAGDTAVESDVNQTMDPIENLEHARGLSADARSPTGTDVAKLKELLAAFTVASSAPSSPVLHDRWLDTTTPTAALLKYWDGSVWQETGAGSRTIRDDNSGSGYTLANGLTLPDADVVVITTGATINTLDTPASARAATTLECQDRCTFQHGTGNLFLAGELNAVIQFGETITFEYDGSATWYEVSRASVPTTGGVVHVTHSGNQTISHNTLTTLAFDTERSDALGMHDTVTNNSRLQAFTAGNYRVWACLAWANNTTGTRLVEFWLNATTEIGRQWVNATGSTAYSTLNLAVTYPLARNDYVECKVYQDSGGNLNLITLDHASPEFGLEWVGA